LNIKKAGRFLPVLFLFAGFAGQVSAQSPDYSYIFGSDWQKANSWLQENDSWLRPALEKHNIPYPEAIAVVFPELVRYSALRDKMEIAVLKSLYCNLGKEYANFSIGVFQIKPSFAEYIRNEAPVHGRKKLFEKIGSYPSGYLFRKSIVDGLEDPATELNYVIAFLRICEKRFLRRWDDEFLKIRFLATAYNTGFWKREEEINAMADKKFFNTKLFKTENYSYADVALFWYNQYIQNTENK
jgi:hypothetical protein